MTEPASWQVDPLDPRAPPQEIWDRLSPEQRAKVVASLPSEFELGPPEGDHHRLAIERAKDPLQGFFQRIGRKVYLSSNLAVYYPGERVFAPDLIAVLDVEPHPRDRWAVSVEGKGLDFALEVNVGGDRDKDYERNVEWFARLGIAEYVVFDPTRLLVRAWHLPEPAARSYRPLLGQAGRFESAVLGLSFGIEEGQLRFYYGGAAVPETRELLARVEHVLSDVMRKYDDAIRRAEEEARRAEEEARRAEEEARRADGAERRLSEALAEIDRLRRGG